MIELRRIVFAFALAMIFAITLFGGNAFAITRAEVMSRAQGWANSHVPYSQSGRFLGYRTDCSGFASYVLGLGAPGMTTAALGGVTFPISKEDLRPGDILLNPGAHVAIFAGWANSGHTRYIAYEQTGSVGSVCRVVPYPYWGGYGNFSPRRFSGISDAGTASSVATPFMSVSRGMPRRVSLRARKSYRRTRHHRIRARRTRHGIKHVRTRKHRAH